jgi:hypothetical protein
MLTRNSAGLPGWNSGLGLLKSELKAVFIDISGTI